MASTERCKEIARPGLENQNCLSNGQTIEYEALWVCCRSFVGNEKWCHKFNSEFVGIYTGSENQRGKNGKSGILF
jgi:hypothetical protein